MMISLFFSTVVLLYCLPFSLMCTVTINWRFMTNIENKRLEGESLEYSGKSELDCSSLCLSHGSCKSFGVDKSNSKCYLYDYHAWHGYPIAMTEQHVFYYWLAQDICPDTYTYESSINFCYKIYQQNINWTSAQNQCIQDGGLLAMVDTASKIDLLKGFNDDAYIGSTDAQDEGVWKFFNGIKIKQELWDLGSPHNDAGTDNCALLLTEGFINDVPCSNDQNFICEIPISYIT